MYNSNQTIFIQKQQKPSLDFVEAKCNINPVTLILTDNSITVCFYFSRHTLQLMCYINGNLLYLLNTHP